MSLDATEHENKIEIPLPTPQHVENVIEKQDETVPHVIQHEGRIVHLEEQQAAHYAELLQRIQDTKDEILVASEHARTEQASMLDERLKRLEEAALKIESSIVEAPPEVVDAVEQAPTEAVQLVPEVQEVEKKIEPKGIRARRKARHK